MTWLCPFELHRESAAVGRELSRHLARTHAWFEVDRMQQGRVANNAGNPSRDLHTVLSGGSSGSEATSNGHWNSWRAPRAVPGSHAMDKGDIWSRISARCSCQAVVSRRA